MSKYTYSDNAGEISGFGGEYENACRSMVIAGMDWYDQHPEADPQFSGYEGIYGIIREDNEDAKGLTAAVLKAVPDCSGAMHQAAIGHVKAAHHLGWEKYMREMESKEEEKNT